MSKVKLLQWNVLFQEKAENIVSLIEELNPDVLCCQELSESQAYSPELNAVKEIAKLFNSYYFEPANISGAGTEKLYLGNAIFSKFPLKPRQKVMVWDGTNKDLNNEHEERIYIEVEVDINGEKLLVGTTHLSFMPRFEVTKSRRGEADKLLRAVSKHKTMYVLTGDFNSTPDTYTIKKLEKFFKSAGPSHDQATFTTIPFEFMGFKATGLDWRIDYVFVTNDIKVLSSRIINTKYSDHLPIMTELQVI